uniref:TLC domain-containing protein n=1 Tax=Lotharella globosa TaxID=91324 RepID=A0A7S4DPA0_9EUKA
MDTDFVTFRTDAGDKFEVFTKPKAALDYRQKTARGERADVTRVLAEEGPKIYTDIKKLRVASKAMLAKAFQTDDALKAARIIVEKGKLKVKVYVPKPFTELVLDGIALFETVAATYILVDNGRLPSFLILCVLVSLLILTTMTLCATVGRKISAHFMSMAPFNNPLKSDTALRQFESQVWQLIVHVGMSSLALYVYSNGEDFLSRPSQFLQLWQLNDEMRGDVVNLYLVQLAIWFVTLVSLRFFEVRSGDHHVMYTHHVVTIGVVLVSFAAKRYIHFGMVVFMLHDISDVPLDIMKILNLLRIEDSHGFYGAEIAYFILMPTWIYTRIFIFPLTVIYGGVWCAIYNPSSNGDMYWCDRLRDGSELPDLGLVEKGAAALRADCSFGGGGHICFVLLMLLECLHLWWTYLLLRIGYRALLQGHATHEVSNEMYYAAQDNGEKLKSK